MKCNGLLCLAFALLLSLRTTAGASRLRTFFTVVENTREADYVGQIVQSGGTQFRFSEDSTICNKSFTLNATSSNITTKGVLDREVIYREIKTDMVHCFVQYFNTTTGESRIRITIQVLDINDEVPHFNNLAQPHIVQVVENVAAPTPLLRLEPIDDDNGLNGTVQFSITSGNTNYFMIMKAEGDTSDTSTRLLFLRTELDFETNERMFNLTITINDMGSPSRKTFDQRIIIIVNNSIDEPPTFPMTTYSFTVPEDHPLGIEHPFANVTAANTDEVLGSIFYYLCEESGCETSELPGVILVNEVTGGLYLNRSLDFDALGAVHRYAFHVKASYPATGTSQTTFVEVLVENSNDNAPYFTCKNDTEVGSIIPIPCPDTPRFTHMDYDIIESSEQSVRQLWLQGNDDDRGREFSLFVVEITSVPDIDVNYARIGGGPDVYVHIGEMFDREQTPDITLSVTIRNTVSPYLSSTAVVEIHVEDINDNAPIFTQAQYNAYISEGSPVGKEILTVEATDSDFGSNAEVIYSIASADKTAARNWFHISNRTGALSVAENSIDYHAVEGEVSLNITATDGGDKPLSSFTIVRVKVVPAITFSARSHQAFANTAAANMDYVYLEFQTSSADGLLLYQQDSNSHFILSLEERRVTLRSKTRILSNDTTVVDNTWYSVLVERIGQTYQLKTWKTGSRDTPAVFLESRIQNCTNETEEGDFNSDQLLFIGGVNPLFLTEQASLHPSSISDFVGVIRNVIIDTSQVNFRCPIDEMNTMIGVQQATLCRNEELSCHPRYSTGCVDYAEESFCRCRGGFTSEICSVNSEQDYFAPIRLRGNGLVTINLPYSFFYDLEMIKISNDVNVDGSVQPGTAVRRRKRADNEPSSSDTTLQKVELRFRPVQVGASVLLHSESPDFVHQLAILETGSEYAVAYQVFDKTTTMTDPRDQVLIINLDLQDSVEYLVVITYNSIETRMALIYDNMTIQYNTDPWGGNPITLFAEQPETQLSIGGAPGKSSFFSGCISSLKIDDIDIPLSGLATLSEEHGGFSFNSSTSVEPYCNLCDLTTCPNNRTCLSDLYGNSECVCPPGHILEEITDSCVPTVPPTIDGLATASISEQRIYYIAGGAGGGILLVAILILIIVIAVRLKHVKNERKKRTYSVTGDENGILPSQRASKSGNEYVRVEPRKSITNDDPITCIGIITRPESHERGSSVSTYQEHADDGDPEIDEPPCLQRRKSTISAESGIRTDTERDSSLRGTSRMDDSGTDYTPQESESDDMTSSCFMDPVMSRSPVSLHLVGSASSVMGVPMKVASPTAPLTPQERKVITPLRPDSIRLSMSEDDHHVTDFDTDISSCNLHPIRQNCSMPRETDSDISTKVSDRSTPKWYKSSTASDNERESERALKNGAYYPTRSESFHYPHPPRPKTALGGAAPDYIPPPSISARKSASPVFPRSPSRRMPPTMMSADSPLTRNTRKYENYPLPYLMHNHHPPPPPPSSSAMREVSNRGTIPRYENHHLQHQISAPQPHEKEHFGGQNGRHVYFAKSSQTLHYCNSIGREHYSLPRQQQQQTSHSSSRPYYPLPSSIPSSIQYRQNRSYSSSDAPTSDRGEPTQFQDLKNVSTINPIAYWEMQDRLKPAVDQMDPYQVLSEPYIQFEDVSTDLSVTESQATLHAENGPDHEVFESQGGGEGTADIGPLDGCLSRLQDHDISSITSDTQSSRGDLAHFPSADCSNEYTATIHGTSSSGDSTPKYQPTNGFIIPSQQSFDV